METHGDHSALPDHVHIQDLTRTHEAQIAAKTANFNGHQVKANDDPELKKLMAALIFEQAFNVSTLYTQVLQPNYTVQ